jgi:D-arabinose 1-dehydrogenase-like Zn-dependent alcohol dehydrogenase
MRYFVSSPQVVGHEIVGTVVRVGKEVKHVKLGDLVGKSALSLALPSSDRHA